MNLAELVDGWNDGAMGDMEAARELLSFEREMAAQAAKYREMQDAARAALVPIIQAMGGATEIDGVSVRWQEPSEYQAYDTRSVAQAVEALRQSYPAAAAIVEAAQVIRKKSGGLVIRSR